MCPLKKLPELNKAMICPKKMRRLSTERHPFCGWIRGIFVDHSAIAAARAGLRCEWEDWCKPCNEPRGRRLWHDSQRSVWESKWTPKCPCYWENDEEPIKIWAQTTQMDGLILKMTDCVGVTFAPRPRFQQGQRRGDVKNSLRLWWLTTHHLHVLRNHPTFVISSWFWQWTPPFCWTSQFSPYFVWFFVMIFMVPRRRPIASSGIVAGGTGWGKTWHATRWLWSWSPMRPAKLGFFQEKWVISDAKHW